MNGQSKLVNIQNADGSNEQYTILNAFRLDDISKNFAIYHKNELANGVQKIYISEASEEPGLVVLNNVADDALWTRVKEMLKVIANNGINENLFAYNLKDTDKIVKQGAKEIGVKDVNPLIKVLPVKEVQAPTQAPTESITSAPQVQVNNAFVENPYSAPAVTPSVSVEVTPATSAPVQEQPVINENVVSTPEPASDAATNVVASPTMPQETVVSTPAENVQVSPQAVSMPITEAPTQSQVVVETVAPVQPTIDPVKTTDLPINKPENRNEDTLKEIEDVINDYFDIMKAEIMSKIKEIINKKNAEIEEVSNYATEAVNAVSNAVDSTLYNPVLDSSNNAASVVNTSDMSQNVTMTPNSMVR